MQGLKKVSRFYSLLAIVGIVFGILTFVSCRPNKVGTVIRLSGNQKESDLGDVIVLLRKEGNVTSVYTINNFEKLPLTKFTNSKAKSKFDEIVFLAIPDKNVSVRWAISVDGISFECPPNSGTKISIPSKYILEYVKLGSTIKVNCHFFVQDNIETIIE